MKKYLIKCAQTYRTDVNNDEQINAIKSKYPNLFDESSYKISQFYNGEGLYGFVGYKNINNENDKIELYITEVYMFTNVKHKGELPTLVFITRNLTQSGPGNIFDIHKENKTIASIQSKMSHKGDSYSVQGINIMYVKSTTYNDAYQEAQEQIQNKFNENVV